MLPTKSNFPGRWEGQHCNICGFLDLDEHIFTCPGYKDLVTNEISLAMFWNTDVLNDIEVLSDAAKIMRQIIERMEDIQEM